MRGKIKQSKEMNKNSKLKALRNDIQFTILVKERNYTFYEIYLDTLKFIYVKFEAFNHQPN